MPDTPIVDWTPATASAVTEPSAVGVVDFGPAFDAPSSRRELLAPEKSKKRVGLIIRRIVSAVVVAIALVALWPAQYGGITGLTVVHGHSMEPLYHTGDLVVSIKQPSYQLGDIISYVVPTGQDGAGGRVIHRVTAIDTSTGSPIYSTTGDNNGGQKDPWMVGAKDIMGRAIFMVPGFGGILGGMSNPLLIGLICGVLVTVLLWNSDPKDKEKKRQKKLETQPHAVGAADDR